MTYRKDEVGIRAWRAQLVRVNYGNSNGYNYVNSDGRAEGEIRLKPDWDCDYVSWEDYDITHHLNCYFIMYAEKKLVDKLKKFKDGDRVLVTGKIDKRWGVGNDEFSNLETKLDLKDIELDPTQGKYSPQIAHIISSDLSILQEV